MTAHRRSDSRLHYFQSRQSTSSSINVPNAPLRPTVGEYVMRFYIGTPPMKRWSIIDTGSALSWVQCKPCIECYKMYQPPFDPSKSVTFDKVTCNNIFCKNVNNARCKPNTNVCIFRETYDDGSVTAGDAAYETFILEDTNGPNITLESIIFGCSHEITGPYDENEDGLVGLSRDPYSFVRQIGAFKFSHCLVPFYYHRTMSKIFFGKQVQLKGEFTPMLKVKGQEEFYHLSLDGISVGKNHLPIKEELFHANEKGEGGFIIDSGTTYTYLAKEGLDALISALDDEIFLDPAEDPDGILHLCYNVDSFDDFEIVPDITFHFTDADLVLPKIGTYIEVENGIFCLAMKPSTSVSILGNLLQQNRIVAYNLEKELVAFAKADCTKF
ncbi:aspartic proteinase CDR1-like [Magnolia sinica]|uniref:aspartic proteinase CDR1-like n=1 Tax=Magnolia sinica TaxID=86752 RepID=UPI0026583955|nr:aspartic proteinase CDR1-like [Magnolia sinica]